MFAQNADNWEQMQEDMSLCVFLSSPCPKLMIVNLGEVVGIEVEVDRQVWEVHLVEVDQERVNSITVCQRIKNHPQDISVIGVDKRVRVAFVM